VGVLVIAEVPGIGPDEDAAMSEALGFAAGVDGCRFRVAGPLDGDGRRIVTYWDSLEQFERWRDSRLAAVLQETGNPVPRMTVWPIDDTIGV
jgi:heme-degrading monooxygenase HmoA